MTAPYRYAVYYAPESGSPLDRFARAWLGRDAETGAALAPPRLPGLSATEIAELTATPRRYGFHATLKAPFRPAEGLGRDDIHSAVADFAAAQAPVQAPPLRLSRLDGFLALRPASESEDLNALARACVERLDHLRAPLIEAEIERRASAALSERQQDLLRRWGYPYVCEEFRFHMTLTGRLDDAALKRVRALLAPKLAPIMAEPLTIRSIALFEEPTKGAPFRLAARFPLARP